MKGEYITRWLDVAKEVAELIAEANAEGRLLNKLFLFVNTETTEAEITNSKDIHVEPLFVCSLQEFDENGLLTIDDTRSNYILHWFAEMIEDVCDEDCFED